jgi:hypothetical protein
VGRLHRFKGGQGVGQLAEKCKDEAEKELSKILQRLRSAVLRRAIVARERSQETFGDEIVALNDMDEALHNAATNG